MFGAAVSYGPARGGGKAVDSKLEYLIISGLDVSYLLCFGTPDC